MMINPQVSTGREDVFLERYDRLLGWSLHLTEGDRELAEDLLHDLFIQFTVNEPDLHRIHNLDGYLYTMLRNLHLAQVRRDTRNRLQQFSIVEYDSAEIGLRTTDPRDQIQAQEQLRRVCQYACARKETAKMASVLILRFFHGYYPEEIVRILRSPRSLADQLLRLARNEARVGLGDSEQLAFILPTAVPQVLPTGYARDLDVFLEELRQTIFQSRRGDCLTERDMKEFKQAETATPAPELSHIVSCPYCLDRINALLGLPLLAERSATEMLGRDTRKRGGGGGPGTGSGGLSRVIVNKLRRRVKETIVHKPQELCVSVNGYTLGSQRVGSDRSELNLIVDPDERINFVEVFSEQKIRLLMLSVDELPPDGPGERVAHVALSDQRTLELKVRFSSPSPTVQVVYVDPTFNESASVDQTQANLISAPASDSIHALDSARSADSQVEKVGLPPLHDSLTTQIKRSFTILQKGLRSIAALAFWLKPASVTAVVALLVITALMFVQLRRQPPIALTAASLLQQSASAEEAIAARTDQVLHRTIMFEAVATASPSKLITRHKIDIWHSAEKGITARRLYDDKGVLIAGDWRYADGVQTIYHHGQRPRLQLESERRAKVIQDFSSVWQLDLSAAEFSSMIEDKATTNIEERSDSYVITAESLKSVSLVKATLILTKSDLHATEQTLIVLEDNEFREFRMREISFERRAPNAVAPAVFDPEVELLGDVTSRKNLDVPQNSTSANLPISTSLPLATAALEVAVLKLLSAVGADMGEQVNVTRTPEGHLRVDALVETVERKAELSRALQSVSGNPALQIRISTVAEALSRQKSQAKGSTTSLTIEGATMGTSIPAHDDLRRHFAAKVESGDQLEESIRHFSRRMTSMSYETVQRAMALKRLAGRFSAEDLRSMDSETRLDWLGLIRNHARALQQEIATLKKELGPVFPAAASAGAVAPNDIQTDAELMMAADRLFALCSEYDLAIHRALSLSPDSSRANAFKGAEFWRSLNSAHALAAKVVDVR